MTSQTSRSLYPRITGAGLEVPTVTLQRGGRRIQIVSIPMAAPASYWDTLASADFVGPAYTDYRSKELGLLRGIKKRLAMSFIASMRKLVATGGLIVAFDGITRSNRWTTTGEPTQKPKISNAVLLAVSGFVKLIATLDDHDKVRAFYLRTLATGPRNPDQPPRSGKRLSRQLTARSERVAERLHSLRGDLAVIALGGMANEMLAWFQANGYTEQSIDYTVALPREEFGEAYVEGDAAE